MLNIKCFHCGKSFALDEEVAASWLEEHKEERPKHYPAQCHFCRRTIKVPVKQIQRRLQVRPAVQEPETGDG
jgi:phage terminase large subunit GpA-like protein